MAQTLMMDIALNLQDNEVLDVPTLKSHVVEFAAKVTKDELFEKTRDELKAKSLVELKK